MNDVRAAFATYLRRYNDGRCFVLIGHSQGSFVLEQLIAKDVDAKPAVRRRLLSAILLVDANIALGDLLTVVRTPVTVVHRRPG